MKKQFIYFFLLICSIIVIQANYKVDFDTSLGKNHSILQYYFNSVINSNNSHYSSYLGKNPQEMRHYFKLLYDKNHFYTIPSVLSPKIPLIVHQIWLGSKPFPEKYKQWQKTWQNLGSAWTYKLWTDKEAKEFNLYNQEAFDREKNYGAKADILRVEILNRYGGLYIDTDFECLQPEIFNKLHHCYDFYTGIAPLDERILYIANGLVAAIPNHPILKAMMEHIKHNSQNNSYNTSMKAGPLALTKIFLEYSNSNANVDIALPPTFFYPLCLSQKGYSQEQILATLKPESIALHYWEGSWTK